MKIKTITKTSLIFSIFTCILTFSILLLVNIFTFNSWYEEEKNELVLKLNKEIIEVISASKDFNIQKKEITEDIEELGGIIGSKMPNGYIKEFFKIFSKDGSYYIIDKKESKFGDIYIPYNVTSHYNNQKNLMFFGLGILMILTILAFFLGQLLISRMIFKDIFNITNQLKNINLQNIKNINIELVDDDEINIILKGINEFLDIISIKTQGLKDFNSQVAHEFKTPLMVISSELEFLAASGKNNNLYQKIENQIFLLNEIVETFLFISNIENTSTIISKDFINIGKTISDNIKELQIIYKHKKIEILYNHTKRVAIKGNRKLFHILIKNLLDNAFKYNKVSGKITIIFNDQYIIIKNTGKGIPRKKIAYICDYFYRIDKDTKGYGIGLYIVKKITNIMAYKIEIDSIEQVETTVKIYF